MPPPRKEASSGVTNLVASVKQHKKFRQLASYSVQCLCKVIAPGHLGWERNVKEAFEAGALEAITDVLQLHSGDGAVLLSSTQCLAAMASNPKYAGAVVASGAVMSMLESVMKAPDGDVVKDTLALMEAIATHNAEALLAGGGADAATRLLVGAGATSVPIALAATRTLEKLNKCPAGPQAVAECGGVGALMGLIVRPARDEPTVELVEAALRALDRTCRIPEYADWVRANYDGMKVLSQALEVNAEHEKITKAGGRLLSRLAAGNIPELVAQLEAAGTPPAEKEFLAGLLANLALEEENAERIIACGGIPALLRSLEGGGSPKFREACGRAIARLAATESGTDALVNGGAIAILIRALRSQVADEGVVTALTPTLTRLAAAEAEVAALVVSAGAVPAVIAALGTHPGCEPLAMEAAGFFESLGTAEVDVASLVRGGVIAAITGAMAAHPSSVPTQTDGTRALIYLCTTEAHAAAIGDAGGMELAVGNLASDRGELVIASLYLITSLVLVPGLKERLVAANGVDAVLTALAAYATEELVSETAQELLLAILDAAAVGHMLADFVRATDMATATKAKEACTKLRVLAGRLVAIASTPVFAEYILENDGVAALVRCLDGVSPSAGMPDMDAIMASCADTLTGLVTSVAESDADRVRAAIGDTPAARSVVGSLKAQPKLHKSAAAALGFLQALAEVAPDLAEGAVLEAGGVDAAVVVLRSNPTNAELVCGGSDLLLALCSTDKGSVAVAKTGGTKQAMATIAVNGSTPGFAEPLDACLQVLQRVAATAEGVDVLVKQGGVDACIAASESASAKGEGGAVVVETAARVLTRLLNRDDVLSALEQLAELAASCRKGRVPTADAIKPVVTRVAYMASAGGFADLIVKEGGTDSLAAVVAGVLGKDDADFKGDVLPCCFKCLSNTARGSGEPIPQAADFARHISASVEGGFALFECLECIGAIASSSEGAAVTLLSDGRTLPMVVETLRANLRLHAIATACFSALAALGGHGSTAPTIADAGALGLVSAWTDDNLYDAPSQGVEAAMSTLAAVASSAGHYGVTVDAATELVKTVVTKCCIEAPAAAVPHVLTAAVRVLDNLLVVGGSPAAQKVNAAGAIRRVVRGMSAHPGYVAHEPCVVAVMNLLARAASLAPSMRVELLQMGAQELIVAGMNAHGTSDAVIRAGAAALGALGVGGEAGRAAIEEVRAWNAHIASAPEVSEDMIHGLGDSARRLGNFLPVPGVVTAASAPGMVPVVCTACSILAEAGDMAKAGTLASGVTSIGRIAETAGAAIEPQVPEAITSVLDVLALAPPGDADTRVAAVHTLGVLAGISVSSLRALYERGALKAIQDTARRFPGDRRLQGVVEGTLDRLTEAVERNAAALLASPEGLRMLVAVIAANAGDQAKLEAMLLRLIAAMGTEEPLYDVLASQAHAGAYDIVNAVLGVLRNHYAATGMVPPGNHRRAFGLASSLTAALAAQGALTAQSDNRAKLQALRMADGTLTLLSSLAMEPPGSATFFANNGIEGLMQLLAANIDDQDTVATCLRILKATLHFATHAGAAQMAQPANMGAVVGSLKLFLDAPQLVVDAIDVMTFTARTTGPAASGIDAAGMKAVTAAAAQYAGNEEVGDAVARLEAIMKVRFVEAEAATRLLLAALERLAVALAGAAGITAAQADDGRFYYYSAATGETAWDPPAPYAELIAAMAHLKEVCKRQAEDAIATIEPHSISMLTHALATHARYPAFVDALMTCIGVLTLNEANVATIADVGGVAPMLQAVAVQSPAAEDALKAIFVTLHRLASIEAGRSALAAGGAIEVVLQHGLGTFLATQEVAHRALSILGALVEGSEETAAAVVASPSGAAAAYARVFTQHGGAPRVLETAMTSLAQVMAFGGENAQVALGGPLGGYMTRAIANALGDAPFFRAALRALDAAAVADANVRPLVETHHAVRAVVMGMRAVPRDEDALAMALEVIGTLGGLEEGEESEAESVQSLILKDAGSAEVLATMRRFPANSTLLGAGCDALSALATDIPVTDVMASRQGLTAAVMELLQSHDFDEELMAHAVHLLAAITYSRDAAVPLLVLSDVVPVLTGILQQHGGNPDILCAGQLALSNLAATETARASIRGSEGALRGILGLIEAHVDDRAFCEEAVRTLVRLTQADEGLSRQVAEAGMHIITAMIDAHAGDREFTTAAFRLLGVLAFVESNLTIIVQHNGIARIVTAITTHPDHQPLMVRAIQALDNIASANKENAAIVIDEGGKELIEMIMSTYPDDMEIKRYGTSALSQLSALENLTRSSEIARKAAAAAKAAMANGAGARSQDPLAEFRHALSAGKVMKLWTKGSPRPYHFAVGPDWHSITWQEPGTQRKLGAIDLRAVQVVRAGTGDGHKKAMMTSKHADPQCCFVIVGAAASLDIEANNPRERDTWVEALTRLLTVFRSTPQFL